MQKVLILTNYINGLYSFRREVIEELISCRFQVAISAPIGARTDYFKRIGCEMIQTHIRRRKINPIADIRLFFFYKKIIKKLRPDIVLTYTIKPNVYGGVACRITKTPYISNITGLGTAVENHGILQKITLFLYKAGLKNASCVFFQNKENAEFFNKRKIFRGKQEMIPGSGVNLNYYQVLDYIQSEEINFMFIARIMKQKGIDQYLETALYIKEAYPNTRFHVLGFCEEAYEQKLKSMHDQGIIQYHGLQQQVQCFAGKRGLRPACYHNRQKRLQGNSG